MHNTVQSLHAELRRLAERHDPARTSGEWAAAWNLVDQTAEQRLRPTPAGRGEPPAGAAGERRSLICPECRGTEFRHVEWVEQVRPVRGFDVADVLHIDGLSRVIDEAAYGEHLWCMNCDTSFELPLDVEYD